MLVKYLFICYNNSVKRLNERGDKMDKLAHLTTFKLNFSSKYFTSQEKTTHGQWN